MSESLKLFVIKIGDISFNISIIKDYYHENFFVTEIQLQRVGYDSYFVSKEIENGTLSEDLTSDNTMKIEMDNYIEFYMKALYKYKRLQVFE
jgi:hypothetical protein